MEYFVGLALIIFISSLMVSVYGLTHNGFGKNKKNT